MTRQGPSPVETDADAEPSGWPAWLAVLKVVVAIPLALAACWGVAAVLSWIIPGCRIGPGTCIYGGIDFELPLALLAMPLFFAAWFLGPFWMGLLAFWIAYGVLPAGISYLRGRGFRLHPALVLKGPSMRASRWVLVATLTALYWWLWVGLA